MIKVSAQEDHVVVDSGEKRMMVSEELDEDSSEYPWAEFELFNMPDRVTFRGVRKSVMYIILIVCLFFIFLS